MAAQWSTQLDLVTDLNYVVEERRDFAFLEPFDCQFDSAAIFRRGSDRVAAHRLVPV